MTDQTRQAALLARLQAAGSQTKKAAIVAEMTIDRLDPVTAMVARRCVILRWFNAGIIRAFLENDQADAQEDQVEAVLTALESLPFVERLDWGLAYHEQTREGLLEQISVAEPALLRQSAALAAQAYGGAQSDTAVAEALYCLVVADQKAEAQSLLDALLTAAGSRQDLQRVAALFDTIEEAEQWPFVDNLTLSVVHLLYRGLARKAQGDLDAAIADYDQAIALNPFVATAFNNRGNARSDQGDLDAAIVDYDQAIALNPDDATVYNNRGNARFSRGDLDAAIADYDQAIALNPDYVAAFNNRGIARKAQGDLGGALTDYDQAIALNPDYATSYYNRGLAGSDQGDLGAAIADYDQAIALNPDHAAAYYNRGLARFDQGDRDAAIADYGQAVVLNPDYASTPINGGLAQSDQEEQEELDASTVDNFEFKKKVTTHIDPEDRNSVRSRRGKTDPQVLRRLQEGDVLAWEQLIAEWQGPLYQHLCYSLPTHDNAADVLQETFTALFNAVQRFDGEVAISTFIYSIASRKVADFFRKRKLTSEIPETLGSDRFNISTDSIVVRDVLDDLQPQYREALLLYYEIGLSVGELARFLGRSKGATSMLLSRSRKQFKADLQDAGFKS